jgi:hypothetical protein
MVTVTADEHNPHRTAELLGALDTYRSARVDFLAALGIPASNRDPLAEVSEQLVHALMGGTLATSRVQRGHDLVQLDGLHVQVRYLANPRETWINEHRVHQIPGVELYALVLFEAFVVIGVLVFPLERLEPICTALGKRHSGQQQQLQITMRNWWAIREDPQRFRALGMRVWLPA